ncbi:MAG: hypothetical protein AB202_03160 [Parcubacteria bacterium C7867-007]|nr:MAG: hypothetical protein AB202_03160 [Parcubacteria bacterium C7867-007]
MALQVVDDTKSMALSLTADDVGSIEEIKQRIDEFARHVSEKDAFLIRIDLSLKPRTQVLTCATDYEVALKELVQAYMHHFNDGRTAARQLGFSRSSLYGWLDGRPIGTRSLRILISKAPTPELKRAAENFKRVHVVSKI